MNNLLRLALFFVLNLAAAIAVDQIHAHWIRGAAFGLIIGAAWSMGLIDNQM